MTALTGNSVASTYRDLLQVSNSNSGIDATLRNIEDGEGTSSILKLSTTQIQLGNTTAVTSILDEDTMSSDSATALATQQSIKAYVDAAAGGSVWNQIGTTQTASASSSINFTSGINSTYNIYAVVITAFVPASAAALWFRTSTDGGSTYDSTSAYRYHVSRLGTGSSTYTSTASSSSNQIELTGGDTVNATSAEGGFSGVIYIYNPSAANECKITWNSMHPVSTSAMNVNFGGGVNLNQADVDAFQLLFDGQNIASGEASLYGIADS